MAGFERFEDSPGLFGAGVGAGTSGTIRCGLCGTLYNEDADRDEDYSGDSVLWTDFAGLTIAGCCFAAIETAVLARIDDVLPWLARVVRRQRSTAFRRTDTIAQIIASCARETS